MAPRPVPRDLICSECGLDWDLHPENPRRRDCIELLKGRTFTFPTTYRVTYPPAEVRPYLQYWWGTTNNTTGGTFTTSSLT